MIDSWLFGDKLRTWWPFGKYLGDTLDPSRDLLLILIICPPLPCTSFVDCFSLALDKCNKNHFILETRSSWLNCALRGDEADNWCYYVSRGHLCHYILNREEIWSVVNNASHTDWQTSKDRATEYSAPENLEGSSRNAIGFCGKKIHTLEYVFMRALSEWLCGRCPGKTIKLCQIGFQLKIKVFAI